MKLLEKLKYSLEKFKLGEYQKSKKNNSITMITKFNTDDDDLFLFI